MSLDKGRKSFRERLNEMIQDLRSDIRLGRMKPGDFLPSEQDLAKRFSLSNLSVRKGLHTLVEEGYIHKIPSVGNQVIDRFKRNVCSIRFVYPADLEESVRMSSLLDRFEERYPHIEVIRLAENSGDYLSIIRSRLQDGGLDAALLSDSMFYSLIGEQGASAFLAPQTPDEHQYRMLSHSFAQEGSVFAKPFAFSPLVLCYNKSHFRELGLPLPDSSWTWTDLTVYAERLTEPQVRYGFYFYMRSRNRWPLFLLQNGVMRPDRQGDGIAACVEKIKEGLREYRSILEGPMMFPSFLANSPVPITPEDLFAQGKLSMIITSYFHLNRLLGASEIDFDIAPVPRGKEAKTLLISFGLAQSVHSPHKEAAQLLVDFLTSLESQTHLRLHTSSIPAHRGAAERERPDMVFSRYSMYRDIMPTYSTVTEMGLSTDTLDKIMEAAQLHWASLEDDKTLTERLFKLLE